MVVDIEGVDQEQRHARLRQFNMSNMPNMPNMPIMPKPNIRNMPDMSSTQGFSKMQQDLERMTNMSGPMVS